ncbi:MAG: hypothetical protein GY867_06345, partial [bacterium]|nr:hypothetical protein [bacterium]
MERAYDVAGHVVRERSLQDYVNESGVVECRWVETRYEYNAREQLVAVERTHLASPDQPGLVISALQRVEEREYDSFGRLERLKALNLRNPALVTQYRFDDASRIAGVKVGAAGEQRSGFDANGRVVLRTDGDEGIWRGRYDVWDRVYHEELPTGVVVRRHFDEANNPTRETEWSADPLTSSDAELLSDVRTYFTSFGQMERMVEVLSADDAGGETEIRVTEQEFDESGRVIAVWSGPALPDSDRV